MKKYTVAGFCKEYNDAKSNEVKEMIINKVMNEQYIPYEKKIAFCENIIKSSHYRKDKNENKKLHISSTTKYLLYCLEIVRRYTNIEVDLTDVINEFNLLNKYGLIDEIASRISEKELKEFKWILDMVENDMLQNEYEIHAFIGKQVDRFGELTGLLLKPVIEQLNEKIENIDEKTIDKIAKKLKGLTIFK